MRSGIFLFACLLSLSCSCAFAEDIKMADVAGAFYPSDPVELSEMIDGFLADAKIQAAAQDIFAVIAPHAGYQFSGKTAAYAYKAVKGKSYKTVVILGSDHQFGFSGIRVYPDGKFRTPLGDIEVDKEFIGLLTGKIKELRSDRSVFEKQHIIEVQLPFLQRSLKGFKIVPAIIGQADLDTCARFSDALRDAIGSRKDVLVVVSTDMYHGYDPDEAERIDRQTLEYLKAMDEKKLFQGLIKGDAQLCGGLPAATAIMLGKSLGHEKLYVLSYTNSAIVTGSRAKEWTVGYSSSYIDKQEGEKSMLNKDQRKKLLDIARRSIEFYLKNGKKMQVTESDPALSQKMGAFVTLHEKGELRGCIGNLVGHQPLYLTVRDMAVEAAVGDPRFPQVKQSELNGIEIEISALSVMERVDSADKIKLGTHGVLVKRGFNSGVFLPQVATETGWTKEEFLSYLCSHKAGLEADAWKDPATELYIFTAEVFSEKEQ